MDLNQDGSHWKTQSCLLSSFQFELSNKLDVFYFDWYIVI